jgi:hypothetical protein
MVMMMNDGLFWVGIAWHGTVLHVEGHGIKEAGFALRGRGWLVALLLWTEE